jgi:hypothetical protein
MMKLFKSGVILFAAILLLSADSNAQWGRPYGGRYRGRGSYPVVRPHVSIGIGGVFGGYYPHRVYRYGRPRVGVSVGIGLPGVGVYINTLPLGYSRFYFGSNPYYYYNDTYYRQLDKGGYETVAPPLGSYISKLPSGARSVTVDNETYYELGGTYYMEDVNESGKRIYIIVGTDGELNVNEALKAFDNNHTDNSKIETDRVYNNHSNQQQVIVHNGNDQTGDVYGSRPQMGDRFDQLPPNSKSIYVNAEKQYVSPLGIYYKEVSEEGRIYYEVVRNK